MTRRLFICFCILVIVLLLGLKIQARTTIAHRRHSKHRSSLRRNTDSECSFPTHWRGDWYRNEQPTISINATHFGALGKCAEQRNNRFLLHLNADRQNCWLCIVVFEKHRNVLLSKETPCGMEGSLEEVCGRLLGDTPLITMFRLNARPEACPISEPINFTYMTYKSVCSTHYSTGVTCASESKLRFFYAACPESYVSDSKVEDIECLGSWNNEGHNYFAGKLLGKSAYLDSENFRCFIYDMKSHGGQLGISADSGCMELTDMENAVIRLDIKIESNPAAQCIFPHWLVHKRGQVDAKKIWQSLTDDVFYKFYINEMVAQDENDFNLSRSLCIETENYGIMDQFVLYSINDCEHGYQCMKIYKRNSMIIEIMRGYLAPTAFQACNEHYFSQKRIPFETLINTDQVKQKCPNQGLYRVEGCDEQESIISFGCTEEHKLEIDMKCDEQHSKKYDCLGHWEQGDITYLVLKETTTGQTSCAVYSHNKDNVVNMSTVNRHSCRRTLMSEQENKQYITFRPSGICGSSASSFVIYSKWIIVCLLVNHLLCNFDYGRKNK
ncbi:hypothetical protein T11_10630 [Trichinella zimbabwensis]|uniref:Uncharacterized protein n=1 Tax=Trichinella zimbabwensis TaxID=268475 RepID=A0A0V1HSN8_9BILA|nr:hypothetical protein T11_10630 [Trichinella zimbabwensis]